MSQRKVELFPYNSKWQSDFKEESELLFGVLGETAINIDHIGSTAIVGRRYFQKEGATLLFRTMLDQLLVMRQQGQYLEALHQGHLVLEVY